jgi:uracil-DNA glycosylase
VDSVNRPAQSREINDIVRAMRCALEEFGILPESLTQGSGRIPGTAFFPGGDGLVLPRVNEEVPDVLVVGHDFGTLAYFGECIGRGEERLTQATWKGISSRLEDAKIDRQRCMFTNAFVGYRKTGRNADSFPARCDRDYVGRCRRLLALQIDLLQPRVIVALGKYLPSFLAPLSADLKKWSAAQEFAALDRVGALVVDATFSGHSANVGVLVHPSFGRLNVGRRRYVAIDGTEHVGSDAEVAILRDAVTAAKPRNLGG